MDYLDKMLARGFKLVEYRDVAPVYIINRKGVVINIHSQKELDLINTDKYRLKSIDRSYNNYSALDLCAKHFARPELEIFQKIRFMDLDRYEISNTGSIRDTKTGNLVEPKNGYVKLVNNCGLYVNVKLSMLCDRAYFKNLVFPNVICGYRINNKCEIVNNNHRLTYDNGYRLKTCDNNHNIFKKNQIKPYVKLHNLYLNRDRQAIEKLIKSNMKSIKTYDELYKNITNLNEIDKDSELYNYINNIYTKVVI